MSEKKNIHAPNAGYGASIMTDRMMCYLFIRVVCYEGLKIIVRIQEKAILPRQSALPRRRCRGCVGR